MPTILITGTSSGIGKATAKYFASQNWNVIATMRKPELETELTQIPNILVLALDVTKFQSITEAIQTGINKFGSIQAIVNNAGFAVAGPFELATNEQISRQFETNVNGVFDCTRAILPHFRANKTGVIVNVSSMGGRTSFPYLSLYHGTKWAIDGFSESLSYELQPLGIKVKIIEPGAIKTDFYSRSLTSTIDTNLTQDLVQIPVQNLTQTSSQNPYLKTYIPYKKFMDNLGNNGESADFVAKTIYKSVTDKSNKLRYTVGKDAKIFLFLRWLLPNKFLFAFNHWILKKL